LKQISSGRQRGENAQAFFLLLQGDQQVDVHNDQNPQPDRKSHILLFSLCAIRFLPLQEIGFIYQEVGLRNGKSIAATQEKQQCSPEEEQPLYFLDKYQTIELVFNL
jgi:hypothetical protein